MDLEKFGLISGLRVDFAKSELYPVVLTENTRKLIKVNFKYKWIKSQWLCLETQILINLQKLNAVNYESLYKEVKTKITTWHKLNLTWANRIHLTKFYFFQFLFLFRPLPTPISQYHFNKCQRLMSEFLWSYKKPRVHHKIINKLTMQGKLNTTHLQSCYEAGQLVTLLSNLPLNQEDWPLIETMYVKPHSLLETFWKIPKLCPKNIKKIMYIL